MNRIIFIFFIFLSLFAYSQSEPGTIKKDGENVFITSRIDEFHEISYWFRKCMNNDLFTFYRVSLISGSADTTIVNEAHFSDNIGPFYVQDGGWCGGNHLFQDEKTKTAQTFHIRLFADGHKISSDTILKVDKVDLEVKNYIFNPLGTRKKGNDICFTDTLCIENINYTITGNNIQVNLSHDYTNAIPVTISKYYGMQSMFNDEYKILTPLGEYASWTSIDKVNRFKKKDFPKFNRYIEKSKSCFQASYLFNKGLGIHNELPGDDMIFIGNSWTKCYHKLIGDSHRISGEHDSWSGLYTWFVKPLLDTEYAFAYEGYIDSKLAIFFSNTTKGSFSISLPKNFKSNKTNIIENTSGIKIKTKNNLIIFYCNSPGSMIISFEK